MDPSPTHEPSPDILADIRAARTSAEQLEAFHRRASSLDLSALVGPRLHDLAPDAIAGFKLQRVLGGGGQGVVYEAVQISTNRKVAIKLLYQSRRPNSREHYRFTREVQAL